jgi:hypothetical protein
LTKTYHVRRPLCVAVILGAALLAPGCAKASPNSSPSYQLGYQAIMNDPMLTSNPDWPSPGVSPNPTESCNYHLQQAHANYEYRVGPRVDNDSDFMAGCTVAFRQLLAERTKGAR